MDPKVDEVYEGVNTDEGVNSELVQENYPDKILVQVEETTEDHHSETSYDRFSSGSESNDDSDDFEDDSDVDVTSNIANDLRKWARESLIPYKHLDSLLKTLQPYHPKLPLSHKTLLKTSSEKMFKIEKFNPLSLDDNSEFIYGGIAQQLKRIINPNSLTGSVLNLQFNIDGLPLYRSSCKEFWPILGKLHSRSDFNKAFVVSVWCGQGKPSSIELYLKSFVEELNNLLVNRIDIAGKHFNIKIICFICDRPARAFIKCIKGHTGYYACERCDIKGYRHNNRTLFPCTGESRTDTSFRSQVNSGHHQSVSPLTRITPPIDMVKDFTLNSMHLCYLGITKKLLTEYWLKSGSASKLKRNDILRISQRLMNLSKQVPDEFQRTTRSLGEIGTWKATEYRLFLLYSGMFILKDILPEDRYNHFLLFSIENRILSCDSLVKLYVNQAQAFLDKFVELSSKLYGEDSQILNMHSLSHLSDDVKHNNCSLSDITAFTFESYLGKLKKYLRSGNKPLSQRRKRLEEEYFFENAVSVKSTKFSINSKQLQNRISIRKIQLENCCLQNHQIM